jgi:hypothetical protein
MDDESWTITDHCFFDASRRKRCHCTVCNKFDGDRHYTLEDVIRGRCQLCGRGGKDRAAYRAPWLPQVLREFLGVDEICWACRNAISGFVIRWNLCWGSSPDEALKWAMVDYIRGHLFASHFYPHPHDYRTLECCEFNHHRRTA